MPKLWQQMECLIAEVVKMATLKCEACGAPLQFIPNKPFLVCDYCGAENTVSAASLDVVMKKDTSSDIEKENPLMISIPSCGTTIFQKKLFNIYRQYVQLVDSKTGRTEINIFYREVEKLRRCFGANEIMFKMTGKRKIVIKCLWDGKTKEALSVLNGLIKPSK